MVRGNAIRKRRSRSRKWKKQRKFAGMARNVRQIRSKKKPRRLNLQLASVRSVHRAPYSSYRRFGKSHHGENPELDTFGISSRRQLYPSCGGTRYICIASQHKPAIVTMASDFSISERDSDKIKGFQT